MAQLRRKNKLRQKQVAHEAQIDPSYLTALENGRRIPPRQKMLTNLVRALKATSLEETELKRTAALSELATKLEEKIELVAGASVVMTVLELVHVMSETEIKALEVLVDVFRDRIYYKGRKEM